MADLHERMNELNYGTDLTLVLEDVLKHVNDITCLATICDETYQPFFEQSFFIKLGIKTVFNVRIDEAEDLLAPNYNTLSMIQEIRRAGCNVYFILVSNGDQAARLLRFGDRHRILDTRAKFLLMYDNRLFYEERHYLWKKIVNVIFIRRYISASRFELSTVPFPAPIRGVLIPRRVDTWYKGKFQNGMGLYRDKTVNMEGQTLRVAVIDHIPSVVKTTSINRYDILELNNPQGVKVRGLEVQMLKSLQSALNFKSLVYETPNSETEAWGKKQLNGSYSGLLGEISSGNADIALGNLYYTSYHLDLLDLSVPYAAQCLTFLTPESLTDNSWMTLVLPFKSNMWIGIMTTLVIGSFLFFAFANVYHHLQNSNNRRLQINRFIRTVKSCLKRLYKLKWVSYAVNTANHRLMVIVSKFPMKRRTKTEDLNGYDSSDRRTDANENVEHSSMADSEGLHLFDSLDNSLLYTYSMLALVSLPKLPTGWALRVMTGCWWLYCILIVVAYRASMTAILANPMPRVMIDTVEQLAASPIRCGGWGEENKKSFTSSLDSAGREIGKKFDVIQDPYATDALARIAEGTFAYYANIFWLQNAKVRYWQGVFEQRESNKTERSEERTEEGAQNQHNLHIMSDCVINMPVSLGLQKNSPLKPQVDKFIRQLIEAGLVKKWLADVMLDTLIMEAQMPFINDQENVKALVDLPKLYAGFIALFIGCGISILILLFEILHWFFIVKKDPFFDKYYIDKYYRSH